MSQSRGGLRKDEESAGDGTADDLTSAHPALAQYLSQKHLGKKTKRLNSEDAHRIAAKIARDCERKEK